MAESDQDAASLEIDPYLIPQAQQGWRGLTLPAEYRRRRVYSVFENDQILVTLLLQIPGGRPIPHSHETGELSIRYEAMLNPIITWNPPGAIHPAQARAVGAGAELRDAAQQAVSEAGADSRIGRVLQELLEAQFNLSEHVQKATRGRPTPSVIIDVLFPPFKTTMFADAYPGGQRTVAGQWYD
jgi:hypothetical protein